MTSRPNLPFAVRSLITVAEYQTKASRSARIMRIAFPMFNLGRAGGEQIIIRLANAAIRRGHEVSFLLPRQKESIVSDTLAQVVQIRLFPVPRIGYFVPTFMSVASFPFAKRLRGFDAVVASYGPTSLPTKLVSGKNVKRYYLIQHDETSFFSPFSLEYWVTRLSYGAFQKEHVFAVSEWLQDMVRRRRGPKPILLPPGIDHGTYYPRDRIPHEGKHVLVLVRDPKWKGLQVFFDAMESVKRDVKDVKIIAAGGSGRRFKTSCPIEYVRPSDDELARLYSSCDVYVLPSFLEGLGLPPLEAMACGGAVVLTDCLGSRDYAIDGLNCLVVPQGNPESLSRAILRVISDDVLSNRLRANGPGAAAPWTYERMETIFLRALESE